MILAAVALVCAVLIGFASGGRLRRLAELRLRHRRLVLVALAAQLAGALVGGPSYRLGLVVSVVVALAFLLANRSVQGVALVALGLLSNALVVGLNGAMPVRPEASGRAGVSTQPLLDGSDPRHELADEGTRLPWLGDVIPLPLPYRPQVVSPGDLLIAAGLAELVVVGMRRRTGPSPSAPVAPW